MTTATTEPLTTTEYKHPTALCTNGLFRYLADLDLAQRRTIQETARFMALQGQPVSHEAQKMCELLYAAQVLPFVEQNNLPKGPKTTLALRQALGAILSDVLIATQQGRAVYRSVRNESFSAPCPVSRTSYSRVMGALEAAGYLDVRKGHRVQGNGGFVGDRDVPTLYQATPRLTDFMRQAGIDLDHTLADDFDLGRRNTDDAAEVVVKRTKAIRTKDEAEVKATVMPIAADDQVARALTDRMVKLNAFLLSPGRVEGFSFGGLRRIFSNADQKGFRWQWGGRLNTIPGWDAYERWKGGYDTRSKIIRLDGEAIAEVDISGAFLTILYGLLGEPFDPAQDPYELGHSVTRTQAKRWCTLVLGSFSLHSGGKPVARVREAFLERHPLLSRLETCGFSNADLQYHESEIAISAVEAMRDRHGVVSLPIHDCIAVPASKVGLAMGELKSAFHNHFKNVVGGVIPIYPRLSVKHPQGAHDPFVGVG